MQENEDSKQFKKALRERDLSALKKIAKGDLHNHAALGGSPKKKGIFPPDKFDGYKGMKQYINTAFYPEMSFLEGYKRYVEATCQQAIEDGVIYLETSIDYRFLRMFKDIYSAFEYLDSLKNKYKNSCKINYDLGLSRGSFRDFSMAKEIISDSDLVIAEASLPATGQGIELGWADYATTPILCIYEKGSMISSSIKFITNNFIEYENVEDMINKINDFINNNC